MLASCADQRVLGAACTTDCGPSSSIHPAGFLDPSSTAFHGRELERRNWSFATCAACHGKDFSGGASGVSCLTCHVDGPTACTTCHGATGPTTFAHQAHAPTVACAECHLTPAHWDDDGHILHDGIAITGPVPVVFGARAGLTLEPADRSAPPAFDGATCSNVYCHGAVLHAAGGLATRPRWDDATPAGACTSCHGAPPPTAVHIRTDCRACHPPSAAHIDGVVDVGVACNACHGSDLSPAPPKDLAGNMFTTALGVGAHQAHLQALSRISAPVPCETCHVVPQTRDSPGHIGVGPAPVTTALGWDRNAQTCSTSHCHGGVSPRWTSSGLASCGSCHGIPPVDASHSPAMTLTTCVVCHAATVDAFGNIIVTNHESRHIDGVVDSQ